METADLDEQGMRATTAATTMTLGGLIKHVALVEADWLAVKLAGQRYVPPWDAVDFDADPDWEWRTGAADTPEDVYAVWRAAVDRSRMLVANVIEEYARHTGHADLLREAVDGRVGEGAPDEFTI